MFPPQKSPHFNRRIFMTQKLICLCAVVALLFAISTANVANANDPMPAPSAPVACPCDFAPPAFPCRWACSSAPWFAPGCPTAVTYRVGRFGHVRPVAYVPAYRPVVVAPCPVVRPVVVAPCPIVRPVIVAPRPVVVAPRVVHRHFWAPVVPPRAVHVPHCVWW